MSRRQVQEYSMEKPSILIYNKILYKMQKLTCIFILLFFCLFLSAQGSFQRHYGQPSNFDQVIGIAHTADARYLAAGTTANLGAGGFDMLFEKVDADGNSLWQTTWGGAGNDGANQVISVSSGGFLASGYTEGGNKDRDFAAVRLDEEGNELWSIIRGEEYDDEATHALEMPDGGLLIIGFISLPDIMEQALLLVRANAAGAAVWERTLFVVSNISIAGCAPAADGGFFVLLKPNLLIRYDGQGNQLWMEELNDSFGGSLDVSFFERTADGRLRICGWTMGGAGKPFLAELDENGASVTFIEIESIPDGLAQAHSLALTPEGKLWVTIPPAFGGVSFNYPFLYLIDPLSGEELFSTTVAELGLDGLQAPYRAYAAAGDEGFLLAGNSFSNAKGANGLLYRAGANAEELWQKTIGIEGVSDREAARMVVETADGGFLIGGSLATATEERNLWLIRANANGNVLWSAEAGGARDESIAALAARTDGSSFALAGYRGDTLIVSAFDDTGAPLWYREYAVGLGDGTFGMIPAPDNELLLSMPAYLEDGSYGLLMKLNAQGETLWMQYYQPSPAYSATYGVTAAADGGYFLCGCAENDEGNFLPLLLKTDANGNELWYSTYEEEAEGFFNCLITVHQHSNGDLFASGVSIGNNVLPYAIRASSDGSLIWSQSLGDSYYFTWFSGLQESAGRQVLFGAKRSSSPLQSAGRSAGAITALNLDGSVEWEKDYGLEANGLFQGGAATSDGGLAAVGTATFDNSQDAWLVKTEADGTVGFFTPLRPPFGISLSPNPAAGWLHLNASGLAEGEAALTVFNLNGQRLCHELLSVTGGRLDHSIRVEHLAPGGYLLHLRQGREAMAVKWVKE